MDDYKKFSIRATEKTLKDVEEFARQNDLSRNAAIGILLRLGIQSLQKTAAEDVRFNLLDEHLKAVYQSLAKSVIYLTTLQQVDQQKAQSAGEQATKATSKIFGE